MKHSERGQFVIEALISISVIALLSLAVVPLVGSSLVANRNSGEKTIGTLLANEAQEIGRAIETSDWNKIYLPSGGTDGQANKGAGNPYHLAQVGNTWTLAAGSESIILNGVTYTRQIVIDNVSRTGSNGQGDIEATYNFSRDDPATQKITISITWPNSTGVTLPTYFTRYDRNDARTHTTQADFSGGTANNVSITAISGSVILSQQ